jgi:CRP-like cAMP-binding protein
MAAKPHGGGDIYIAECRAGEYFGETALLGRQLRNATVRAATDDVRVLPVNAAHFERLMSESATFRSELATIAAAREAELKQSLAEATQ